MIINKKKIVRWLLLVGWMIFIFCMSQQPGDISSGQSDFIVNLFGLLGIDLNSYFGDLATFVVRKGAHFSEYFILFILWYRVLILYTAKRKAKVYGIILVFLYASSDEFHQYFIPGRAAAFKDVMIDTFGGLFASIVTIIYEKIKNRDNKNYLIQ